MTPHYFLHIHWVYYTKREKEFMYSPATTTISTSLARNDRVSVWVEERDREEEKRAERDTKDRARDGPARFVDLREVRRQYGNVYRNVE